MAQTIGGKAAKIAMAAVGAAALSAVGTGAVLFRKWAKDPYSKELWFGFLKKGILITKTEEPRHYRVQTGYRWHNDAAEDAEDSMEVPVMEIPFPEETEAESKGSEASAEDKEDAPEEPQAGDEA